MFTLITMEIIFGLFFLLQKEFHCQHNTRPKKDVTPHEKHTNCPGKLTITVNPIMKK